MNTGARRKPLERQMAEAMRFMETNDRFLVVSHVNPDGDAVASTCAVGWMLDRLGKRYTLINEGSLPGKFKYLCGYDRVVNFTENPPVDKFDRVISVDCADMSRMGEVRRLLSADAKLLNIDHHPTNDGFGEVQFICDEAAATVELLYDLARHGGLAVDKAFAECIYTGLLTDTGGFRYSNTSPKVLKAAAELITFGVEGHKLASTVLETVTYAHINLLKRALASLSFAKDRKISWMTVTAEDIRETGASPDDLDGLIQYPRNIEGVEVGILFKQLDDGAVKVGFRSAGKVNVAAVAQSFGGGGHLLASGCTMRGPLEQVIRRVVEKVGQALE
jgi:phosphoesterase RecJ-like protein